MNRVIFDLNFLIISEPLVSCVDVSDFGTLRYDHYSLTFESETIWQNKGRGGRDRRNWGQLRSKNRNGDQVTVMYYGGDFGHGCKRNSRLELTYECGDYTEVTRVEEVYNCYYEVEVEVACNQAC